jgi:hypothetical protein
MVYSTQNHWVNVHCPDFYLTKSRRFTVGEQLSEEGRDRSGVPQGRVLGPLLFLVCVNDNWRNIEPTIRFFADDCIIYGKVINKKRQKNCR